MGFISNITWCRWKVVDMDGEHYTVITVSVPKPGYQYPTACLLVSLTSGSRKVMMRFSDIKGLKQVFVVPCEYDERIGVGYGEAVKVADGIQRQLRAVMKMGGLGEGGKVIRTDTGEIIAEAENIIKGAKREKDKE